MAIQFIEPKRARKISHREWLIAFSAFVVVAVSLIFPQTMLGESFWLLFFLFFIFPVSLILFIFKQPLAGFGFSFEQKKLGWLVGILLTLFFLFINYFLVFHSPYAGQIPVVRFITFSFFNFILYQLFLSLPLHFFSEVFFRGFLQLGLERKLGYFSLLLASAAQTALFFQSSWIVISLIFFSSLAAGIIVRFSRSLFFSTAFMWIISVSLDIMLIRVINQGRL